MYSSPVATICLPCRSPGLRISARSSADDGTAEYRYRGAVFRCVPGRQHAGHDTVFPLLDQVDRAAEQKIEAVAVQCLAHLILVENLQFNAMPGTEQLR